MDVDKSKLNYAALTYCAFWNDYDSKFSDYISSEHYPMHKRINKLKECLCKYSIQRNVRPTSTELDNYSGNSCEESYNPKKHQVILEVLDGFNSSNDWVSDVYRLEAILYERLSNKVHLLSLASKVLWQKVRGNYLVYDNYARKALKVADNDISEFYARWNAMYLLCYPQIVEALEAVIDDSPFMFYRYNDYRQDWFYRRIFDTYLINLTAKNKRI